MKIYFTTNLGRRHGQFFSPLPWLSSLVPLPEIDLSKNIFHPVGVEKNALGTCPRKLPEIPGKRD